MNIALDTTVFPEKISDKLMNYLAENEIAVLRDIKDFRNFRAEIGEAVYFHDEFNKEYNFRYIDPYKESAWLIDSTKDTEGIKIALKSALEKAVGLYQ